MQTFLEQAASHIFHQHTTASEAASSSSPQAQLSLFDSQSSHSVPSLDRLCVVLPTRRGVYFFKQALAALTDEPFLSPEVIAVDDFIQRACGLEPIDSVSLLFELFDTFKAIDPNIEFDRFTSWGTTLLQDFDRIDQYLVDAKPLFNYMSEAEAIKRWNLELPRKQALQAVEGDLAVEVSAFTNKYFLLFENLLKVYTSLRDKLTESGRAYRGMAYRLLAEHTETLLLDSPQYEKYYFIGFNALSTAEETIIKRLVKAKRAEMLWDSDSYYMDRNPDLKAGELLKRYKREGYMGPWNWQSNHLLKDAKHIRIIGVANASMQSKVAGQIYNQWRASELTPPTGKSNRPQGVGAMTAIVLADENLLMPLMYSLDESVEDFNITMGLSLKNSTLYTLIDALFDLQRTTMTDTKTGTKIPKFNHRNILKVLNHPFIQRYELILYRKKSLEEQPESSFVRKTVRDIVTNNKVFLSSKELMEMGEEHSLFKILFSTWDNKPERALQCFYDLIDLLREVYRENQNAIETEYLFLFYTLLKRLENVLEERSPQVSMRNFRVFLYEMIRQTKIPFNGEPFSSLQIIGMLETRTLDFEKLIILSVNEKVLPLAKKQNSLIPYDAATEFGLPTHGEQDAVMSYHFYRLLQRAKEVVLLHVLPSDTYGANEKSRFIHQIENELARQNPKIRITHQSVAFPPPQQTERDELVLRIDKSPRVLEQIRHQIATKGIYPSNLNMFVSCSMRYYFNQIAKIGEAEEVEEKMGADKFGEWIHKTLENIDKELSGRNRMVQKEDVHQLIASLPDRLKAEFAAAYGGYEADSGMNFILYRIAENILNRFFNHQLENESFPMEVLGLEKTLAASFKTSIGGQEIDIKVAGKVDRIDRVGGKNGKIRVIDYKTGKAERKDLEVKIEELENTLLSDRKADKIRQLWLYKYIIAKRISEKMGMQASLELENTLDIAADSDGPHEIVSGIYSFRNITEGLLESNLLFEEGETPAQFIAHSEKYLAQLVERILDPAQPFEKTQDLDMCPFCNYKGICGR